MLTTIHPKLPMRDINVTRKFYVHYMGFALVGEYEQYLIVAKDNIEIHFFEFKTLEPGLNYGQVYIRTDNVEALHKSLQAVGFPSLHNTHPEIKPWGQKEFSMLDPDNNLLTFGQAV